VKATAANEHDTGQHMMGTADHDKDKAAQPANGRGAEGKILVFVIGGIGGVKRYHSLHRVIEGYCQLVKAETPSIANLMAGARGFRLRDGRELEFHQLFWGDIAQDRIAAASTSTSCWLGRLPVRVEDAYRRQWRLFETGNPAPPLPMEHLERAAEDLQAAIRLLSMALVQFRDDREEMLEAVRGFFATYETHVGLEEHRVESPRKSHRRGRYRYAYASKLSGGSMPADRPIRIQQRIFDEFHRLIALKKNAGARVHIIAHSLGSVMALRLCVDVETLEPALFDRIASLHVLGSPLELFVLCHPQTLGVRGLQALYEQHNNRDGAKERPIGAPLPEPRHAITIHDYVELSDPVASELRLTFKLLHAERPGRFRAGSAMRYVSKQLPVFSHTSYWTEQLVIDAVFSKIVDAAPAVDGALHVSEEPLRDKDEGKPQKETWLKRLRWWVTGTVELLQDLLLANRLQSFVLLFIMILSCVCAGVGGLALAKARAFENRSAEEFASLVVHSVLLSMSFFSAFLASGCFRYFKNVNARRFGLASTIVSILLVSLLLYKYLSASAIEINNTENKVLAILLFVCPILVVAMSFISNRKRGMAVNLLLLAATFGAFVVLIEGRAAIVANRQMDVGGTIVLVAVGLSSAVGGVLLARFLVIWVAFVRGREHIEHLALRLKVIPDGGRSVHRTPALR